MFDTATLQRVINESSKAKGHGYRWRPFRPFPRARVERSKGGGAIAVQILTGSLGGECKNLIWRQIVALSDFDTVRMIVVAVVAAVTTEF